jgi:hypothetical protein
VTDAELQSRLAPTYEAGVGALRAIDDLCAGRIDVEEALRRLESVERMLVRHGQFVAVRIGH